MTALFDPIVIWPRCFFLSTAAALLNGKLRAATKLLPLSKWETVFINHYSAISDFIYAWSATRQISVNPCGDSEGLIVQLKFSKVVERSEKARSEATR